MKLVTEFNDVGLKFITEAAAGGSKRVRLEGVFMQAEKPNRNKRRYPMGVLRPAVEKYINEQVKTGRAVGELNHPEGPTVNLDKVSHRITELKWDGNNVVGKALILDTPMGKIVKGLIEGGVQLGVSTRGMGSLEQGRDGIMEVKDDFILSTVDIVQDPSAPDAFVNGIMEGVEFFLKGNEIVCEKIKDRIHNTPMNKLEEAKLREFKLFLDEISRK